jgi:hypothetical protein
MNLSAALALHHPFAILSIPDRRGAGYLLGSSEEAFQMVLSFVDRFPQASALIFKEVKAISQRLGLDGWEFQHDLTASVIFSSPEFAMEWSSAWSRGGNTGSPDDVSMIPGSLVILPLPVTAFTGGWKNTDFRLVGIQLLRSLDS